jgi:CRISPR locus-related DNA-binding protein
MSKRIYINFGFDISGVVSSISSLGIDSNDEVIIIVPMTKNERSEHARAQLKDFFNTLIQKGIDFKYRYLEVNETDITNTIKNIINDTKNWNNDIYFEATGGVRSIIVAMVIAATILGNKVKSLYTIAETKGKRVKAYIPPLFPPIIDHKDQKILKHIGNKTVLLEDITKELKIPKSTLSRRLRKLQKMGIVERIGLKPASFKTTLLCELLTKTKP